MKYLFILSAFFISFSSFAQSSYLKTIPKPNNQEPIKIWERPDHTFNLLYVDADTMDGKAGIKLMHIDSNANIISSKLIGDSSLSTVNNIVILDDAHYIISSCLYNDYRLLKCDTAGNSQVMPVFKTNSSGSCGTYFGMMANGNLYSHNRVDSGYILIMNQNGDSLQSISIKDKFATGLIATDAGGFLILSNIQIQGSNFDTKLTLIDSVGQQIWQKIYANPLNNTFYHGVELADGFLVSGKSEKITPFGNELFNYTVKIDKQGNLIKEHEEAIGTSWGMAKSANGNILLNSLDHTRQDKCRHFTSMLSTDGSTVWSHCFDSYPKGFGNSGIQSTSGSFYFLGQIFSQGNYDILLIKIAPDGGHYLSLPEIEKASQITCYPNPGNTRIMIRNKGESALGEIQVFDALGNKVYSTVSIENETELNTSSYPDGIYFYRIKGEYSIISTGKFIVKH